MKHDPYSGLKLPGVEHFLREWQTGLAGLAGLVGQGRKLAGQMPRVLHCSRSLCWAFGSLAGLDRLPERTEPWPTEKKSKILILS